MSHRLRFFLVLLGLLCCAARVRAADATIRLGRGYEAQVDEKGVVCVRRGDAVVLREVFAGTWVDDEFADQMKAVKVAGWEREGTVMRSGTIPRPGTSATYKVFVRSTPPDAAGLRGLLLTYVIETPLFPKAKASVLARLPLAGYAGKAVEVEGKPAGVFPAKERAKHIVAIRRKAHELLVLDEGRPLVFMGRQSPGEILVQDSRKWGAGAYEVQFALRPTPSQPASRRLLHLLVSLKNPDRPVLGEVTNNHPPPKENTLSALPKFGLFQAVFDLWARFENPYDPEQIKVTGVFTGPGAKAREVRGFFFQDFERTKENGLEKLTPVGPPRWAVRYTPTRTGTHSYVIRVETDDGTVTSEPRTFYATDSDAPGFVRVHRENPRYFQYTNGRTYFPVGHNVAWCTAETGSYDYDTYFRRMGQAGENYTRVWMCSWDTGIEGTTLDSYRLDAAWRLDYVLELARRRGIRVKLCLDNATDYQPDKGKRKFFGYWKQNGGPCVKTMDFFTNPVAQAAYRRRLDYVIARWGHSPNLMAWELWNEINYLAENAKDRATLVAWTAETAAYVKEHDPYRHLVSTSLGQKVVWDEVWELEDIDFAQIHWYLPQPNQAETPEEKDAVLAVRQAAEQVDGLSKPFHISEYGYLDLPKVNRPNEMDEKGVHLHNALWAGLFSGAAATPAIWWWKEYVHPNNLYQEYASVAGFVENIDLADTGWKRLGAPAAKDLRVFGLKKADACALWIQRTGNHWYRRTGGEERRPKPLVELGQVRLRVPDVEPGKYRVTWWDTSRGEITHFPAWAVRRKDAPATFDLILEYETGAPDIAVKAKRMK